MKHIYLLSFLLTALVLSGCSSKRYSHLSKIKQTPSARLQTPETNTKYSSVSYKETVQLIKSGCYQAFSNPPIENLTASMETQPVIIRHSEIQTNAYSPAFRVHSEKQKAHSILPTAKEKHTLTKTENLISQIEGGYLRWAGYSF